MDFLVLSIFGKGTMDERTSVKAAVSAFKDKNGDERLAGRRQAERST